MVSKKWLKLIKSLHQKKYRIEHQLFFVEGKKVVDELLGANFRPKKILVSNEFQGAFQNSHMEVISENDFKNISALKNPNGILGVFEMPKSLPITDEDWVVVLDNIRDPGNLGTIVRLCDWFGITNLICSPSSVDLYNPKVLQATMGSVTRVNVVYVDLFEFLKKTSLPVYGTYMEGNTIYHQDLPEKGILILGNEANGISSDLNELIEHRITIPQFGNKTTESLNVAMAGGIFLSEIRRRTPI